MSKENISEVEIENVNLFGDWTDTRNNEVESRKEVIDDVDDVNNYKKDLTTSETNSISYEDISKKLLKDKLLLSALELHAELIEKGNELRILRDFFSNPGNFETLYSVKNDPHFLSSASGLARSDSHHTLDSIDFLANSEDGDNCVDERIAVLEFELRKANETIKSLRNNLTVVAVPGNQPDIENVDLNLEHKIKPHEKRMLNFLINEYLLLQNYKLTSNTFADENEDQDFEDWDDVGLNVKRPPELSILLKDYCEHTFRKSKHVDAHTQTEVTTFHTLSDKAINTDPSEETDKEISSHNSATAPNVNSCTSSEPGEVQAVEAVSTEQSSVVVVCEDAIDDADIETPPCGYGDHQYLFQHRTHYQSATFLKTLVSKCCLYPSSLVKTSLSGHRIDKEIASIANNPESLVCMLSRCLPHIVPNIILAKREELVPLILCAVNLNPNHEERDKLLSILFNLIKRPDLEQRTMILTGFAVIAQHLGPEKVESEILPQCWEQINHKYVERRLLVAESCGVLLPYVPSTIRSSLIFSMIQQCFEDKEEVVRLAAIKSLALLFVFMRSQDDKFAQSFDTVVETFKDESPKVLDIVNRILLPSFYSWACTINYLETHVVPKIIFLVNSCVQEYNEVPTCKFRETKLVQLLSATQMIIPFLFIHVLLDAPFFSCVTIPDNDTGSGFDEFHLLDNPALIFGDTHEYDKLIKAFNEYIGQEWFEEWEQLLYVTKTFLNAILSFISVLDPSEGPVLKAIISLFHQFSHVFGHTYLHKKIKPAFYSLITLDHDKFHTEVFDEKTALTKALVPVYAAGVLTVYHTDEDVSELRLFLEKVLLVVALCKAPLTSLKSTFNELIQFPFTHSIMIDVLWTAVKNESPFVRASAGALYPVLVANISEPLLNSKVVPALFSLASDSDSLVLQSVIPAFGAVLESTTQRELLDKVYHLLQTFLENPEDNNHILVVEIIKILGKSAPNVESIFRENFIFPKLLSVTQLNRTMSNGTRQRDIVLALIDAFTSISCCFLSEDTITTLILPTMKLLLADVQTIAPTYEDTVRDMMKEFEAKSDISPGSLTPDRLGSFSNLTSMMSQGVEMKNKMTKLMASKSKSPLLPTLFKKKPPP